MNWYLLGVAALLVVFQVKHFLADYILQGRWMLRKFEDGWTWVLPLTAHAGVHAAMTAVIVWCFTWCGDLTFFPLWMALLDFVLHFTMDRLKAGPRWLGRHKPLTGPEYERFLELEVGGPIEAQDYARRKIRGNKFFWWSLGLDQMVHHLTHYLVVFLTVARW